MPATRGMKWWQLGRRQKKVLVYQILVRRSASGLDTPWAGSVCCVLCMGKVEAMAKLLSYRVLDCSTHRHTDTNTYHHVYINCFQLCCSLNGCTLNGCALHCNWCSMLSDAKARRGLL